MADNKSKFELLALDKAWIVSTVDAAGAEIANDKNKSALGKLSRNAVELIAGLTTPGVVADQRLKSELSKLGLDTHDGRKEFLSKKIGIDASTPDNYRLVVYTNDSGQVMLFKAHMDGDKKLVLTDSIACPESPDKIDELFQSSFKPITKPIEIQVEKATDTKDGTKMDLSPEEKKKLETQTTLVAAMQKSGAVELTLNTRLPGRLQVPGAGLNA